MRHSFIVRRATCAGLVALVAIAGSSPLLAQHVPPPSKATMTYASLEIPASIRAEHAEIHDGLVAATKAPDPVGAAARDLAAVLDPHFVREEQIALPPLGLLAPLARGEFGKEMMAVLPLTDSLRAELPRMLHEHEAIHAATVRLANVASANGNTKVHRLAEQLLLHAQTEEQVFYPAALLVGRLVQQQR